MKEIKSILMSENGMKIVNALFLLSILIRNRGIIFAFYSCWIIYLAYCIRNTKSKAMQISWEPTYAMRLHPAWISRFVAS